MNTESGVQLGDLGGMVRRRARWVLWAGLVVFLATFWIAMALPNQYESYATILVEPQAVAPELFESQVANTDLTRRLGLMTSRILARSRLSSIIDDLDLYGEESKKMLREEVIDLMRQAVRVEPVVPELQTRDRNRGAEEIDTFQIFFMHHEADTAAAVAQRLANDFLDSHIRARVEQSQKSLEFMEDELARLAASIREVESRTYQVQAANPGRLPDDQQVNNSRLDRILTQLSLAQRALVDARSDEAFYRSQQAAASVATEGPNDAASAERRTRLLELALAEYEARGFTDKHPDVVKARLELASLEAQIQARAVRAETEKVEQTFLERSYGSEMQRAEQRRVAAEAEVLQLQNQMRAIENMMAQTPRVAEELSVLGREYRHLFESYQDFSNRRLEATLAAQLERRQLGEQFRVLETAFPAPEPSSPNRVVIVVLGAFFAIVLAGAVGVLLELADPSVHSARQLQASLGVPVLGAIPQISLESDRALRRRRILREVLAVGGLISFVLVGSTANYFWVNGGFDALREAAAGAGGPSAPAPAAPGAALPEVPEPS